MDDFPLPAMPNGDASFPNLFSLVTQSKKALQHGQQLCVRANELSNASAQAAVDVMALDAKVRWMTDTVLEQLKLAANVAKSIELRRSELRNRAQEWDVIRNARQDALDAVLESLGTQHVPPDFYTAPSFGSSPFGSQLPLDSDEPLFGEQPSSLVNPGTSPTETLRGSRRRFGSGTVNGNDVEETGRAKRQRERMSWKTLRDFVDERAVEDVLDSIEADRNALDDVHARTSDYPESLTRTIDALREGVKAEYELPRVEEVFTQQEEAGRGMADRLDELERHYSQMAIALEDSERGEHFEGEDLQAMTKDTEVLPSVVHDLEEGFASIETSHEQLQVAKRAVQESLDAHRKTLDDLDELAEIMGEMLERQESVESESTEHVAQLHQHLVTIEDLHHRFTSYQYSYNKLLLELARRRQYRASTDEFVRNMLTQLDAMAEEERQLREEFNAEHGQYLPEDVCLYVQNGPTRWIVRPEDGEQGEVLPQMDEDLLHQARNQLSSVEERLVNSQSL